MKNLLEESAKAELLGRIDRLKAESKAVWGTMNVNQGLRHMNMALDIPIGLLDPTPARQVKMPKWLLKYFLLNVKPPRAKAETFREINMVANGIKPTDFAAEQAGLKDKIIQFFNTATLVPENKLVGKFSRTDWGKLCYNHTDHHLRQFGV